MKAQLVYDFTDYREFLRLEVGRMLEEDPDLGYRGISKRMGLSSPNYIQLIFQGKRNLSPETAKKCARLLDLNADETSFFVALVVFNQATSIEEKLIAQKQMFSIKGFLKAKPIEAAQFKYFSDWSIVLLREMIGLKNFIPDPELLKQHIPGEPLSAAQIENALKRLVELRLVDKSLEGKYFIRDTHVELPAGMSHSFVFAFHRAMLERSLWALMNLKSHQREMWASTVSFDASKMQEAKKFLEKMRTEFISQFSAQPGCNSVYQLNYQFFEMANLSQIDE